MKDAKAVTVVVPTLNEEAHLEPCLQSIVGQKTDADVTLVVCDGFSDDATPSIAARYADAVVHPPKRGVAVQRNTGAKAAEGENLLFVDADTVLPASYLDWALGKLAVDGDLVAFSAGFRFLERSKKNAFLEHLTNEYLAFRDTLGSPTLPGFNIVVRHTAFECVGGFRDVPLEDIDISRRLSAVGKTRYFTDTIVETSSRRLAAMGVLGTLHYYFEMDLSRSYPELKKYLVYTDYVACRMPHIDYGNLFTRLYGVGGQTSNLRESANGGKSYLVNDVQRNVEGFLRTLKL